MLMEIDTQSLKFKEKLLDQGSKAKKSEGLVKRLQALHEELKSLEQERVDKSSLSAVSRELVHSHILKHDDKTVRAITACCLADILRLHAPNAPYSKNDLKRVFEYFISQLRNLNHIDDPRSPYYVYLLETLSTVKSVIIIGDLSNAEELSTAIFASFFNITSPETPRNIQVYMTDILIQLVEEVGLLSQDVIELLLEQIDDEKKARNGASYQMAVDICRDCARTLKERVCQYFTDALVAVGRSEGSEEEYLELEKVHTRIQRIHSALPNLLLNVIHLLEEEMNLDDSRVRQIATVAVSQMLAEKNSTLWVQYPSIWKAWLGRRNDKEVQLRIAWLEACGCIYNNRPDVSAELDECLRAKLSDPEEKVRSAACKAIGTINIDLVISNMSKSLLEEVASRCKDKKHLVRKEAMNTLGNVYDKTFCKISAKERAVINQTAWIPTALLECMYIDDSSVLSSLEVTIRQYILPDNENDSERTDRLVNVFCSLNDKSKSGFLALIRKQKSFIEAMQKYVSICEESHNSTVPDSHLDEKAEVLMKNLATCFPEKFRILGGFRRFMEINDDDLLTSLRTCIDPNQHYNTICNAKSVLLRELEQHYSVLSDVFEPVLNRAIPTILNKSCIPFLFKLTSEPQRTRRAVSNDRSQAAYSLLKEISRSFAIMYQGCVDELMNAAAQESNISTDELELLAQISKECPISSTQKSSAIQRFGSYICKGDPVQAEYAAIILCNSIELDADAQTFIESLFAQLKADSQNILSLLSGLAQFASYHPRLLLPHFEDLADFIDNVIMSRNTIVNGDNPEWIEYEALPESSKQKITSIRLLVNYMLGSAKIDQYEESVVHRTMSLLWRQPDVTCDMAIENNCSAAEASHLRLVCMQSIVELTRLEIYQNELTVPKFERVGLTLQDSCYYVREEFAETMMKNLQVGHIHPRYYALLFLCAHEPELELLKRVKHFIHKKSVIHESGHPMSLETSFVQLIHLLAHHPDFNVASEDLFVFSQYIEFFLSCIAKPDNVYLLYHIAQTIKSTTDMVSSELSQNSYILCDLACLLIKRKCKSASWKPMTDSPQRISLQSKLYRPLPSGAIQAEVLKKNYLPAEFVKAFDDDPIPKAIEKRSRLSTMLPSKRNKVI